MLKMNGFMAPALVLASFFMLAGCGGRPKQRAAAQAEPVAEVPAESAGNGAPASGCEAPARYNEACPALFELTGPVKSCQVECWETGTAEREYEMADMMWSREYGFNRRGYLEVDGCTEYTYRADTVFLYGEDAQAGMSASLTYDATGRIVAEKHEYEGNAVGDGARETEFSYDDAGLLTRAYTLFWETGMEITYAYDAQGRLASRREMACDYDGNTERIYTYEYVAFDGRGNWTQRRVTVKCTVTQPEERYEHERSEVIHEPDAYQFESRKITYYE